MVGNRWWCAWLAVLIGMIARADEVDALLKEVAKAGPNAVGSAEARQACGRLAGHGVEILPRLLLAMDTENVVAANWYRTVYETLVARELAKPKPNLPLATLKKFASDPRHKGRSRRLVLELLERLDRDYKAGFIADRLGDPEFNAEAVDAALKAGNAAVDAGRTEAAKDIYRQAFDNARQSEQVLAAADRLKDLGEPADPVEHLGFVVDWRLIGPFDAPAKTGFATRFPPEEGVDLSANYPGQKGATVRWKSFHSKDRLGTVDLMSAIAPAQEAVGYAYAELESADKCSGQLRCGADDNLTVWLNGKKVFGREQWLNGTRLDRFVVDVEFAKGINRVLVKVCQGPHHRDPSVGNNWTVQLRFCDSSGKSLGLKNVLPGPAKP